MAKTDKRAAAKAALKSGGEADLAFRYRHGWIKIVEDAVAKGNIDPVGHEGLGARVAKANATSVSPFHMPAETKKKVAKGILAKAKSADLANEGDYDIDLSWDKWNAEHKGNRYVRSTTQKHGAIKSSAATHEIRRFQRIHGLPVTGNLDSKTARKAAKIAKKGGSKTLGAQTVNALSSGDAKKAASLAAHRRAHSTALRRKKAGKR
jgi:hypothetical protein